MSADAELKENTAGAPPGDLSGAGESEAQKRGKARWASMSDADKEAHRQKISEGVRRAAEKKRAKARGEKSADDAPRAKTGARGATASPAADQVKATELASIREGLSFLLSAPSMVGSAKGDPWLTDHFLVRGPALAAAIADEAARNDQFRAYLVRLVGVLRGASLIGALAMYVGPVLMHMGTMPNLLGVPVVGQPQPGAPPQPHFVAPERGPAVPVDPNAIPADEAAFLAEMERSDGFADELDELRNSGGFVPPLPMEAV